MPHDVSLAGSRYLNPGIAVYDVRLFKARNGYGSSYQLHESVFLQKSVLDVQAHPARSGTDGLFGYVQVLCHVANL
jgi:hypothetical protein